MRRKFLGVLQLMLITGLLLPGCNKWDDHNSLTDPMVGKDLFQQISENAALSKFAELLTKSGYDKVIASSKTYTVFAPTNTALSTLDPAIVNDSARLRMFVGNHIANQLYQTTTTPVRLQMLNGKYNNLQGKLLEDANITIADQYTKNGYLQVLDKMLPALPSAWEFLETSPLAPAKQKAYLLSLFRNVFNPANAVQIGINPATGLPIYQAGTDSIRTNIFWRDVHDLRNESKQYTFFMLSDAAWDSEENKYKPFFITGDADSTTRLADSAIVKDLAVEGYYPQSTLPDTLLSKFNVKVGINKSAIVQTVKVSNGIVYIMRSVDVRPKDKFQQYIIEAESYRGSSADRRGNTYFRDRFNPLTGQQFRDVLVFNHGLAMFNLNYRLTNVPALKFRAYWVALHDNINNNTATFTQKLGIGSPTSTVLPYITVAVNDYREIYIGEFSSTTYMPFLNLFLTAANTTTANTNPIVCDYIRLEPVL
ncbi:fasciclin domain-containing protein [Segetibacter sp. 3557_3]|uniref:fasciclin domain-containing protein n=1 Tax=Segetibacter sp. 3557_3 TaxID=2547429 RepID=UPI0014042C42|nr:fasciclin domain-containing protein [Segetibacter sp. 3557_3]